MTDCETSDRFDQTRASEAPEDEIDGDRHCRRSSADDCPRSCHFLRLGLLAAISIPVDAVYLIRTGYPPSTLVPILVMNCTGIYLFVRFLNQYPVPAEVEFD